MKKTIPLLLTTAILALLLTACGGNNKTTNRPPPTGGNDVVATSVDNKENQSLVIYHISDDEIELHFTSDKLSSIERLAFLAPSGDENGAYNSSVNIDFERDGDNTCPFLIVFSETMDVAYTIDSYGEEMVVTVEENTLICRIKHENIIAPFAKTELWHMDSEQPQPFEGIITDDISTIIEPVVKGILPEEFKQSEYDEQYFKPNSDDFVVITYEQPIVLYAPVWYKNRTGVYEYGPYRDENTKQSSAIVTYILSFDGDSYTSTKIRIEYKSIEDAMYAGLIRDFTICPVALGYENEPNDDLVTADYFEQADQMLHGERSESDHDYTYHGHFDQFRYFEYKVRDTLPELKTLVSVPLTDCSDMLAFVPVSSLSYSAGDTQTCELLDYSGNVAATTYSSKRTHQAGSDNAVLDEMFKVSADKDYFKPLTDDYVYVIYSQSGSLGDDYYAQNVYLYSFDESGNLVQYIQRICSDFEHGENGYMSYVPEAWLGATEYVEADKAMYTDMLALFDADDMIYGLEEMTHKENLLFELTKHGQHEGFYFSKP